MSNSNTQPKRIATITQDNRRNGGELSHKYETTDVRSVIVFHDGELKKVAFARWYSGRSRDASVIRCSVWIVLGDDRGMISGSGTSGGYGYCKRSSAFAGALESAGVTLSIDVDAVGMNAVDDALAAVANALGYADCPTMIDAG